MAKKRKPKGLRNNYSHCETIGFSLRQKCPPSEKQPHLRRAWRTLGSFSIEETKKLTHEKILQRYGHGIYALQEIKRAPNKFHRAYWKTLPEFVV